MDLTPQQEQERQKYLILQNTRLRYGSGFHGAAAVSMIRPSDIVVDFGAGRNDFCLALRAKGIEAKGIDWVFPADIKSTMWDVPLPDNYADVVTSFDALEHLLPEDVNPTLKEMRRVGKANGRFIFSISFRDSHIRANGETLHPTIYSKDVWLDILSQYATVKHNGRFFEGVWHTKS